MPWVECNVEDCKDYKDGCCKAEVIVIAEHNCMTYESVADKKKMEKSE